MVDSWRSHATKKNVSVLEQHELVFLIGQSTEPLSRCVKVRNPTGKPVIIQMLLNPEMVVDQCNIVDFFGKEPSLTGHGFMAAESAVTEAVIQPYGSIDLGPIYFRPCGQCRWRSSAVVRNNLSGVEWVILRSTIDSPPVNISRGTESSQELGSKLGQRPDLNSSSSSTFFCNRLCFNKIFLLLLAAVAVLSLFHRWDSISR